MKFASPSRSANGSDFSVVRFASPVIRKPVSTAGGGAPVCWSRVARDPGLMPRSTSLIPPPILPPISNQSLPGLTHFRLVGLLRENGVVELRFLARRAGIEGGAEGEEVVPDIQPSICIGAKVTAVQVVPSRSFAVSGVSNS